MDMAMCCCEANFVARFQAFVRPPNLQVSWVRGCLLTSAFDAGDSADPNASWGEVPATYLALLKPVQIVKLQGCRDSEVKFLRPTKHSDLARENHGENLETPALRAITNAGPAELEVGSDAQSNAAFGAAKAVVELAPEREIGGAQTLGVRLKVLHDFDPPVRGPNIASYRHCLKCCVLVYRYHWFPKICL